MTITIDGPFAIVAVGVVSFLCGVAFMMLRKVEATRCDIGITRVAHDKVEFEIEVIVDEQKYTANKYLSREQVSNLNDVMSELNAERAKPTNDKPS